MGPDAGHLSHATAAPLVVADWTIDARTVVAACRKELDGLGALHIIVPAWLHGLDWAGDPWASVPCARRQFERIARMSVAAGLEVVSAGVGDPDPVSAIGDAVAAERIDRILLFGRGRHVSARYPLSVARRAGRLTGLPVRTFAVPLASQPSRRGLAAGHCEPTRAGGSVRTRPIATLTP